jgi:hypothetical protein
MVLLRFSDHLQHAPLPALASGDAIAKASEGVNDVVN